MAERGFLTIAFDPSFTGESGGNVRYMASPDINTEVCTEKQISFSLLTQLGGYTHNKGYTTETSLRVIIIGISEEELIPLGIKLKEMVNTNTILITKTEMEYSFI